MYLHSFLLLLSNTIALCEYTTICLPLQLLMGIWVISSLGLLQIKLLLAFMYKSFYGHMLSYLLGNYLRVTWLDHMEDACLTF